MMALKKQCFKIQIRNDFYVVVRYIENRITQIHSLIFMRRKN
jgi:hypothetical protein